jgi:hypothetical protein
MKGTALTSDKKNCPGLAKPNPGSFLGGGLNTFHAAAFLK